VTPEQFERQLAKDLKALRTQASAAVGRTASSAVSIVKKNTPLAFGELQHSIHATDKATIVSAPHAQAVEVGSRPHLVPLEDLIAWVKLRGTLGLGDTTNLRGPSSREHSERVAGQLRHMERGGSLSVNAPEIIARRIQYQILQHGIKPTWFVQKSLPDVMDALDKELQKVFK
jgi:hypothetical protein